MLRELLGSVESLRKSFFMWMTVWMTLSINNWNTFHICLIKQPQRCPQIGLGPTTIEKVFFFLRSAFSCLISLKWATSFNLKIYLTERDKLLRKWGRRDCVKRRNILRITIHFSLKYRGPFTLWKKCTYIKWIQLQKFPF